MRDETDMLVCICLKKYERHWIHFTINRLVFAIIILAVCGNTIGLYNVNALANTDCTSHKTCAQCTNMTACKWSFENQSCVTPDQSFPPGISGKSCPNFKMTYEINSDTPTTTITIKLAISKVEVNFAEMLNKSEIKCEVDNAPYTTTYVVDDQLIICNYKLPATFYDGITKNKPVPNPLLIVYFTIAVNGVRWKFDDDRDHYVAMYPMGLTLHGQYCDLNSKCTTGFWNVGPTQYYCKWCLDNEGCKLVQQEGKCYVRDTEKGTRYTGGNASVVHVKDGNVAIERVSASVGPVAGGTTVSVTIRNHEVLAERREVTVTVASRECRDPKTVDHEKINCTVANTVGAGSGPVLVSYRSPAEQQVYVLGSADPFRFETPQITRVRGPTCGPLGGGTRLTVVGRFLDSVREVRVSLGERGECDVRLRRDDLVECDTGRLEGGKRSPELPVPVNVSLDGVPYRYDPPFAFRFVDTDPSSVNANQMFAGIASGGTRLTVRGRFECLQNPRVYVVYNGQRVYGAGGCAVMSTTAGKMVCRAPKLPDPSTVGIPAELPIGFQWTFGGRLVNTTVTDRGYALSPDPVFTHFRVVDRDGSDPATVTIHGRNLDGVRRRVDVNVRILQGPSESKCVVRRINRTWIECRVNGNRSVADAKALVIAVGTNLNRTVTPSDAAPDEDHGSNWLQVAGVVVIVTSLLAVWLSVKIVLARSSKMWNVYELRNTIAEIYDEKHSLASKL